MNKQVVVPGGMMKAVREAIFTDFSAVASEPQIMTVLEAALRWLSENPIVPNEGQERSLDNAWTESKRSLSSSYEKFAHATAFGAVEWQRRMFLAPKIPEAIKDLLSPDDGTVRIHTDHSVNCAIVEAYRRGRESRT